MKRLTQWTVLVALAVVAGFASSPAQAAVTKYWDETSEQFSFEGSAIGTDVHNGVSPFSNWGLLYTNGRAKVADRAGTLEFMEVNSAGAQAIELDRNAPGGDTHSKPWAIERRLETGGIPADVGNDIRGSFAFATRTQASTTHKFEMSWSGANQGGGSVDRIMQIYVAGQGDGTFDLEFKNGITLFENLIMGNWYEAVFEIVDFQGADLSNKWMFSLYDSTGDGAKLHEREFTLGIGSPAVVTSLDLLNLRGDREGGPIQMDFFRLIASSDQSLPEFVPLGTLPEPASAMLLALGGIAVLCRRRR